MRHHQDLLINKLFYSKDPFEDLKDVHTWYDGWYDRVCHPPETDTLL